MKKLRDAPSELASSEIVLVRGASVLAYPKGRHQSLRSMPFAATVCVPVSNESGVVERALSSLMTQTFRDFAIVIVDNASSDHSHRLARHFADQHPHVVVYQTGQPLGRSSLWSLCLDLSFGEFTKILEAADYLMASFMDVAVNAMRLDPETSLLRTGTSVLREGQLIEKPCFAGSRSMTGPSALVHALTSGPFVGHPSSHLMRKSALDVRGLRFRNDLSAGATTELALQLFVAGDFAYVNDPLTVFDEDEPRTFNQCGARASFREECEARLSVLRSGSLPVTSRTLIRTLQRIAVLFEEFCPRAEDEGQEAEIERDYASVICEVSTLLARVVHAAPAADDSKSQIARLLVAAERESKARRYTEAESQLRQVLAVEPCHSVALGDLGRVCFARDDLESARKYFLSALAVDPELELWPAELEAIG
jgi:hypothetical protein